MIAAEDHFLHYDSVMTMYIILGIHWVEEKVIAVILLQDWLDAVDVVGYQ